MNPKSINIILVVIIVILVGVVGYFIVNQRVLPPTPEPEPEPQTALLPYIEFEASVISLSLDESGNYYEGGQLVSAPSDAAIIRIDKIVGTGGSYNFDWASVGVEKGKNVSMGFKYTIRPTKIITVVGKTTQADDAVSRDIVPTKVVFENNYFVFRENGNSETETILPGLQVGSRFKTKLWNTSEIKIGKYEIIP